jgi:prevent-host-death family protein
MGLRGRRVRGRGPERAHPLHFALAARRRTSPRSMIAQRVGMSIITIMTTFRLPKKAPVWSVANAKARLSEVIDLALTHGPQEITRRGREAVMVVSAEEWKRRTGRKGSFVDFLNASPLRNSGLRITRLRGRPRKVDL